MQRGGRLLLLDEVHRYLGGKWAVEIKQLYDRFRQRLSVIFTGSSVLSILNEEADLSRRVLFYRLPGLSFREYLLLAHRIDLPVLPLTDLLERPDAYRSDHRRTIADVHLGQFADYLTRGYYPFSLEVKSGYQARLNSVVQTVLSSDITHRPGAGVANVRKLTALLSVIAESVPFQPNYTKLAERVGMHRNELADYVSALEQAQLISTLQRESSGLARLGKPAKVYFDNPNLIYALAPGKRETGMIRETFFFNQLSQLTDVAELHPPRVELPKSGDFVWRYGDQRIVFEVGGPTKSKKQIVSEQQAYLVKDELISVAPRTRSLWQFGLLY